MDSRLTSWNKRPLPWILSRFYTALQEWCLMVNSLTAFQKPNHNGIVSWIHQLIFKASTFFSILNPIFYDLTFLYLSFPLAHLILLLVLLLSSSNEWFIYLRDPDDWDIIPSKIETLQLINYFLAIGIFSFPVFLLYV